jgi:hypothetical protein
MHALMEFFTGWERMAFSLEVHKLSFSHCLESKMKKGSSSYDESKMHEYEFAFQSVPNFFLMHIYMFKYAEQMISCHLPNLKPIHYTTVCQKYNILTFTLDLQRLKTEYIAYYKIVTLQTYKYQ